MYNRYESEQNAKLKKLERLKKIFLTLAVILSLVLLLAVVWNFFSASLYVDLNSWGPFILLVLIVNWLCYYYTTRWFSGKNKLP